MIYVTSVDGLQVEPLINISDDFKLVQSTNGDLSVSFTVSPGANNPGYELLTSEAIITVDGYDFKVKQFRQNTFSKSVTAINTFFEHSKTQRDGIFSGSHTLNNHLAFVLNGIGWTFTVDAAVANVSNYIDKLGNDNVIALVEKLCKYHGVEYLILPNKRIHFAKQIGPDNDYQYRYKYNVTDVVLMEDTSNLYTFIRGYGAEGLEVNYTSPNVSIFGKLEAAPFRDDRFKNRDSLLNHIKNSITDVPQLAIDSTIPELTAREIGERVWLIYEPLGIEMQTRILQQTKVLVNKKLVTSSVVFGNTLLKSTTDVLIDQQSQIDDTVDYVNESKDEMTGEYRSKFEQTDERITLEVEKLDESIAAVDVKADEINISVNNRITDEVAAINVRAGNIELSVRDFKNDVSAAFEVTATQISAKIDKGGAITDINLTPGNATINAEKINLNGAVMVNGTISGASSINISTDAYVGNNIYLGASGSGTKMVQFNNGATISADSSFSMNISALNTYIDDGHVHIGTGSYSVYCGGYWNFNNASVSGLSASYASSAGSAGSADRVGGFSFTNDTAGKLSVYHYGSKLGDIDLV